MKSYSTMDKLILIVWMIPISAATLPENAHRINSCPQAKNKTAWEEASKRLQCEEDSRKNMLYHCLPSTYLNETIEFCGKLSAVSEEHCPIYNYENGATVATSKKCSNFTNGCPKPPNPPFHSETFYLYPACFEINKEARCYYAEPNCPKEKKRYDPYTTITEEIFTTRSIVLYTTTATTEKDSSKSINILPIVLSVLGCVTLTGVIILVFAVCYRRKKSKRNGHIETREIEELTPLKCEENFNESCSGKIDSEGCSVELKEEAAGNRLDNQSKYNLSNSKKELDFVKNRIDDRVVEESIHSVEHEDKISEKLRKENLKEELVCVVVENVVTASYEAEKSEKLRNENLEVKPHCKEVAVHNQGSTCDLLPNIRYYKLWRKIKEAGRMEDLKLLFKNENNSGNEMELVLEWDRIHNLQYNIWILQALLYICDANDLVSECAEFAKSTDACYISRDFKENERDIIYIHTKLDATDKDLPEGMEGIQKTIASYIGIKEENVQLYGLKKGSLIFMFSLPKRILNTRSLLDPSLTESLKKYKVYKLEHQDTATMTEYQRFDICVHLVCKVNHSTTEERLCIHVISKRLREKFELSGFNFKVFEDLATMRPKRNHIPKPTESITNELSRKEIQRKKIHEEMEPNADLRSLKENFPEYYNTFEPAVCKQGSRKEKSEMFFECLDKLEEKSSKEIQNIIFGKYVFGGKTLNGRDLSNRKEKIKTIISSQRTTFIDEIDSTFIDDTLKSQVTARGRTKGFQDNKEMSRKDRVNAFLDFVLKNEEYLIPFDDVLNNNEDLLKTIQTSLYE